jgi:hypothetical protein
VRRSSERPLENWFATMPRRTSTVAVEAGDEAAPAKRIQRATTDIWLSSDIPQEVVVTAHGLRPDAIITMKTRVGNCTFA